MSLNESTFLLINNKTTLNYLKLENLSSHIADIGNVYILPTICYFGIFTNVITVFIIIKSFSAANKCNCNSKLYNGEMKTITQPLKIHSKASSSHPMLRIMLTTSIVDLLFLMTCGGTCIIRCGALCNYGYTFISKVYEQVVQLFIGNSLMLLNTFLDIRLSLNRLTAFTVQSNLNHTNNIIFNVINCLCLTPKIDQVISKKSIVTMVLISIAFNLPDYLISRQPKLLGSILKVNGTNNTLITKEIFFLTQNSIGEMKEIKLFLFILTVFRTLMLLFVLLIINFIIILKFQRYITQKTKLISIKSNFLGPFQFVLIMIFQLFQMCFS
jgi:hypothetical protein